MLVGLIRVLFIDEISTGIHILNGTALVSLLQPAPETYELFDDIIILTDGQIVYQGPRENVLEFFESMGFKCPERKGVADFLQEVTSRKDQRQYWANKDEPYSFVTVKYFAEAFQIFHIRQKLRDELAKPFDKSKCHANILTTKKYGVNKKELLKACASREYLLMKRNSFVHIFKVTQDGGTYMGALFFRVTVAMFNGISELNMTIKKLSVFYKQRDLLIYPAWAYSIPPWILKILITLIEVVIREAITYYAIGYDLSFVRAINFN